MAKGPKCMEYAVQITRPPCPSTQGATRLDPRAKDSCRAIDIDIDIDTVRRAVLSRVFEGLFEGHLREGQVLLLSTFYFLLSTFYFLLSTFLGLEFCGS